MQEQTNRAHTLFEAGLKLSEGDVSVLTGLAFIAYAEDETTQAHTLLHRVSEINPLVPFAHHLRGLLYDQEGKRELAREAKARGRELSGHYFEGIPPRPLRRPGR